MAMRSLGLANLCNIVLCPLLIFGLGPVPALGLTGAAMATTIGRGTGVIYQLYHLFSGKRMIKFRLEHFIPDWKLIGNVFSIAWTGSLQFIIGSASWIALARIITIYGKEAVAGYGVAVRIFIFCLLPAWGMSNAAATLVGQNLGAKNPDRAEKSVWKTAWYNSIFMFIVTLIFQFFATPIVHFINPDPAVEAYAEQALRIISIGYVFYGIGMVVTNAFNGAGDTKTPTIINIFVYWLMQVPLAYGLAISLDMGPKGVFLTVLFAETASTIIGIIIFRQGKWKKVKV
jgi:putative MATE family efflux protein